MDKTTALENLVREMRDHLKDPKGQNSLEMNWVRRANKVLGEEPCGLFTINFDDGVVIKPEHSSTHLLQFRFSSFEEAELANEQLQALLRVSDEMNDIANMQEGMSQFERFKKLNAQLQKLRHGEVEI